MNNSDIIANLLVTGASGTVGHELVKQLLASPPHLANHNIIAGVHSKNGAEKLNNYSGLKIVDFDYSKSDTITNAFRNVNSLFLLTIPNPDSLDNFVDLINLAKNSGISYVVKLSVQETIDSEPKTMLGRLHKQEEKIVEESGIPHTFLCPTGFMQNFVTFYGDTIRTQNVFYAPTGDGKVSFVDSRDIATVAATILLSQSSKRKQYENQSFNLTGPEALSYGQAAEIISNIVGRKISYRDIPESKARDNMEMLGMKKWLVDAIIELHNITKSGKASGITDSVESIIGRKPHRFEEFVIDYISSF
ncbi:MAG: SDR family oxidoreductase [Candidatus Nitrosocosmicus sp.]|nr:SDR family oxidoreductase [Candidatus Nitrosocosmicus sp.]